MRVTVADVSKGREGIALPATSVEFASGRAELVVAETEQRPTILGLIATGRMRPDSGSVTIDGRTDAAALRRRLALVDAPDVSEPAANVAVAGIVAEELMFAGRRSDPLAALRWLDEHGAQELTRVPIADVAPARRLRLLLELATLRRGVDGVVLVSPDRHGGDPREWWALAQEFAARGLAVLVVAGEAAASVLAAPVETHPRARSSRVRPRGSAALLTRRPARRRAGRPAASAAQSGRA
ncbi:hypothetical protein G5T42_05005 [Microbacterium sp. 4R-513]|uniref:hypothetical protein n=1 Tax=Microbacterium sp. 4R-513 TaxID=2567934 RepID=UPI0013E1DB75|nr:hypothetical protein [Microbacterium sp. 4R-513]QIG38923.1 hypothetical protein G5T42_05005 [Microbacterium sp. 4R-513]